MRSFFDPSPPVLRPEDLVPAMTRRAPEELLLPPRAVIVFTPADLDILVRETRSDPVTAWRPFHNLYRTAEGHTVLARSHVGGPTIAALVEELSAFGVREICLWGYCGGIGAGVSVGDVILATGALREEGVSSHYLDGEDEIVASGWAAGWAASAGESGFRVGAVWTSDAIYRETATKVARFGAMGLLGVEMETASFYAVCGQKGVGAAAFLVVSDLLCPEGWRGGFGSEELKAGARRLATFIAARFIA